MIIIHCYSLLLIIITSYQNLGFFSIPPSLPGLFPPIDLHSNHKQIVLIRLSHRQVLNEGISLSIIYSHAAQWLVLTIPTRDEAEHAPTQPQNQMNGSL